MNFGHPRQETDANKQAVGLIPPQLSYDAHHTIIERVRRALELDHLHLVLTGAEKGGEPTVRILYSSWPERIKELALARNWHGGELLDAARRSKRGFLNPAEVEKYLAGLPEQGGMTGLGLGLLWLFPLPERGGLKGEIWAGRRRLLNPHEESLLSVAALPLMRAVSQRYAKLFGKPQRLTPREVECLRLASEGKTSEEIARMLTIAPTTVETHFKHAVAKLAARNRPHAVAEAIRVGLIN